MASRVSYKFLKHPEEGQKLPPQAVTILQHLEKLGGLDKIISRDDLCASLEEGDGDKPNALNARQPVERVIAFYQKRLSDDGHLEVHKPAAAPKAEKGGTATAPKGKAKVPAAAEDTAADMQV